MYLSKPDKTWKAQFLAEQNAIYSFDSELISLFHIGSTAIDNLHAKDCIDMLGVVPNINDLEQLKDGLKLLGYEFKGEFGISGRAYFTKEHRKVHFHVFQSGDINIEKHLRFVKEMKASDELVARLNELKLNLFSKYPEDKDAYQRAKASFYLRFESK